MIRDQLLFAALGAKGTVIEQRDRMLEFCDEEVVEAYKVAALDVTNKLRAVERLRH